MNFGEVYMKKELSTSFDTRQHMKSEDFEIFYYKDLNLSQVSLHIHSHYEFYYFVEGSVSYRLGDNEYLLEPGDCLLIPPGLPHTLSNAAPNSPTAASSSGAAKTSSSPFAGQMRKAAAMVFAMQPKSAACIFDRIWSMPRKSWDC